MHRRAINRNDELRSEPLEGESETLHEDEAHERIITILSSSPNKGERSAGLAAWLPDLSLSFSMAYLVTGCSLALLSQHMSNKRMIMNRAQLPAWTR